MASLGQTSAKIATLCLHLLDLLESKPSRSGRYLLGRLPCTDFSINLRLWSLFCAGRLSDDEYLAPEMDYNKRPVLTGAPEEVGANPEEEWELAYEEMEQRDRNTVLYNARDELDEKVSPHTRPAGCRRTSYPPTRFSSIDQCTLSRGGTKAAPLVFADLL